MKEGLSGFHAINSVRNSCVKVRSPQGKDLEKVTCPDSK
jgi:hypothetical protein